MDRTPAVQTDDGYVCGVCGSPYWIDSPTDVACENGHLIPRWQIDALYGDDDDQ